MKNTKALDSKISAVNRIGMKMQFSKGMGCHQGNWPKNIL